MNTEQININGLSGNEIIFREGKARDIFIPKPMNISGIIDAPFRYIEKQKSSFPVDPSVRTTSDLVYLARITVNREEMRIILCVDPKGEAPDTIIGSLEFHEDFVKFGINSGEERTTTGLAELFKMNRSCFKDRANAMKLVSDLRSFKAKVDKDIEKTSDDRANYTLHKAQAVESNIPKSFHLNVPIFKGQPARSIEVEININAESLNCSLISPEANDYISEQKNLIIDEQIKKIQEIVPELVIIEV
jgi:hypothetical protein